MKWTDPLGKGIIRERRGKMKSKRDRTDLWGMLLGAICLVLIFGVSVLLAFWAASMQP